MRFLPLYDNVYLGYANRLRMLSTETADRINMFSEFKPPVLIDGTVAAGWTHRESKSGTTLEIQLYRKLLQREREQAASEGEALARFLSPEAKTVDVRFLEA